VNFVNDLLIPHLAARSVWAIPLEIGSASGAKQVGGNVSVGRLVADMVALSRTGKFVTSFVDRYGFEGERGMPANELEQLVNKNVRAMAGRHAENVKTFITVFEFESLLLSDVEAFSILDDFTPRMIMSLRRLREKYESPEEINGGYHTAASRQILNICTKYKKATDGPKVALEIGLEKIRNECYRFNQWLTWLENPFSEPSW